MKVGPWLGGLWSHSGAVPVLWDLCVLLFTSNWGSQLQIQGPVCPQFQQHPPQCGVQPCPRSSGVLWALLQQLPSIHPCAGAFVF